MGKYDRLRDYLMARPRNVASLVLSLEEIRDIINAPLPTTAWKEGVFWANNTRHPTSQSAAWMKAGWRAHEDVQNGRVRFTRDEISAAEVHAAPICIDQDPANADWPKRTRDVTLTEADIDRAQAATSRPNPTKSNTSE